MAATKIFLSYSHDTTAHKDRVLALADRLRADGLDAVLDQYELSPPQGWPHWASQQISAAEFVLVVCTPTYGRRFRRQEQPGEGHGAIWEGAIITQSLYNAAGANEKFIPILFTATNRASIPTVLQGVTCYLLDDEVGYEDLYRRLSRQPKIRKPILGALRPRPPRERKRRFPDPAPGSGDTHYADDRTRELSDALEEAYERRAILTSAGRDTAAVQAEIRQLAHRLRDDGELGAGDFLLDGRFKLQEEIDHGGFGTVWRAYDRTTRRIVAIKILHAQYSQDQTRRERFFRGARKMAELQHPGIVQVILEGGEDRGYFFFVMEYVVGGDLRQAVQAGRLGVRVRLQIILEVSAALDFAHQHGMVHRDIKPANILLDRQNRPKLTDFDLVRALDTTGGTRTGMIGTVIYAAPEAMQRGQEATPQADIYSLGMTAIFALHGRDLPKEVLRSTEHLIAQLEASRALQDVLAQAVAWKPEDRFPSVDAFCTALKAELLDAVQPSAAPQDDRDESGMTTVLTFHDYDPPAVDPPSLVSPEPDLLEAALYSTDDSTVPIAAPPAREDGLTHEAAEEPEERAATARQPSTGLSTVRIDPNALGSKTAGTPSGLGTVQIDPTPLDSRTAVEPAGRAPGTVDEAAREINLKIVYCGPGQSGKSSNLQYIYQRTNPASRSKLIELTTESDQTLFFDFLPLDLGIIRGYTVRVHLYTVPGATPYGESRRLLLKGTDGVIFVADSRTERFEANGKALREMEQHLKENDLDLHTLPYALQLNQRDALSALPLNNLYRAFNHHREPTFRAIASEGNGVFDTLKSVVTQLLQALRMRQTSADIGGT